MTHFDWQLSGYVIFVALNIIDFRLTKVILGHGGREFNPMARFMIKKLGMKGLVVLKVIFLSLLGIQLAHQTLDLYTIWYLDFMFFVVLAFMWEDGRREGLVFFRWSGYPE